jgi:hypothetical protein
MGICAAGKKKRPFWQLAEKPVLAGSGRESCQITSAVTTHGNQLRTVLLAGIGIIIREKDDKIIPFYLCIIPFCYDTSRYILPVIISDRLGRRDMMTDDGIFILVGLPGFHNDPNHFQLKKTYKNRNLGVSFTFGKLGGKILPTIDLFWQGGAIQMSSSG